MRVLGLGRARRRRRHMAVTGELHVGGSPVDVKLAPDGLSSTSPTRCATASRSSTRRRWPSQLHPDRSGRARSLRQPRRHVAVCHEPARRAVSVIDFATGQVPRPGPSAAARTWAASRPTARSSGCPAATTPRCTSSTPAPVRWCTHPRRRGPHGLCAVPAAGPLQPGPHRRVPLTARLAPPRPCVLVVLRRAHDGCVRQEARGTGHPWWNVGPPGCERTT